MESIIDKINRSVFEHYLDKGYYPDTIYLGMTEGKELYDITGFIDEYDGMKVVVNDCLTMLETE